jgi:electron transport complex protein RnfD
MQFPTSSSPFIPAGNTVNRVMLQVLLALLPVLAVMYWLFGFSILIQLILACTTTLLAETGILYLRKRPIKIHLYDLSASITAVLLTLAIPSIAPWWIIVYGSLFAIIIGKHLYGGLGYNPFNPAMAAYVFLLISFPLPMTTWQTPFNPLSYADAFNIIFTTQQAFDGLSSATLLDYSKTQLSLGNTLPSQGINMGTNALIWVPIAYLLGGLWLLHRKIISWHIPVAVLLGLSLPASIMYVIDATHFSSPLVHLLSGASLCGAFFIATDPVSAATSNKGRLIYGLLIGCLIYIIRTWAAYPDAIAFAVLLANLSVPAIDHYLRPKAVHNPS